MLLLRCNRYPNTKAPARDTTLHATTKQVIHTHHLHFVRWKRHITTHHIKPNTRGATHQDSPNTTVCTTNKPTQTAGKLQRTPTSGKTHQGNTSPLLLAPLLVVGVLAVQPPQQRELVRERSHRRSANGVRHSRQQSHEYQVRPRVRQRRQLERVGP
ncbi:unnamed protein product [Ectocarpus sp. 12 AP-2014]